MLNPFFLQGSKSEQGLVQDLINEQLRMYGVDVYYLPRQYMTEKTVIKEVIESEFNEAFAIEAYLETFDGYSDSPTILSKFGIQATNEITLIISRERFKNYISPLIKRKENIKLSTRPKEGDLIFFPLGKRLFEIKYVEHEKPFYQLQGLYTYQLRCELFRYEDEIIDTSIEDIDNLITGDDFTEADEENVPVGHLLTLNMVGVTATATATIANGGVRLVNVLNRGGGYTTPPVVAFSSAPFGGRTAEAVPTMISGAISGILGNDNLSSNSKSVQEINLINAGFGYTETPKVRVIGDKCPTEALASAELGDGIVGIISVTNPGSGYSIAPVINIVGISSISAEAISVLSDTGSISSILIKNAGLGYTENPTVIIENPSLDSTGSFIFNEKVIGEESGTTGIVKAWDINTFTLELSRINGDFIIGEKITGMESEAIHYIREIEEFMVSDGYAANEEIEMEADNIIDFSEINPFGMP